MAKPQKDQITVFAALSRTGWLKPLLCCVVLAIYLALALPNINTQFFHVSEDTNGSNGTAAYNWYRFSPGALKGGLVVNWLTEAELGSGAVTYYADHPVGFLLPTYILYKIFGVDEWTTRLGPLFLMTVAFGFLFFALARIFQNPATAFWSVLGIVLLPGAVYYGKHLDMSPPSLAWSLITFSLFIFLYFKSNRLNTFLFLSAVVLGGFVAWHFYFMPFSLWLFLLLTKSGKEVAKRKLLLFLLPLIVFLTFVLNLLHIYVLAGQDGLRALQGSFFNRTGGGVLLFNGSWYQTMISRFELNLTWWFLLLGLAGFLYFLMTERSRPKRDLLMPLWLMPLAILLVFQQWSTHPFGPIYFLPIVGIGVGFLWEFILKRFRLYGVLIVALLIFGGVLFTRQRLNYFYNDFLILTQQDIVLLEERVALEIQDNQLCVGRNDLLYYEGIVSWYIRKKPLSSPGCLSQESVRTALLLRLSGDLYRKEIERFLQAGFTVKQEDCPGMWCLATK